MAHYVDRNDRYDVGLWCEALSEAGYNYNNSSNSTSTPMSNSTAQPRFEYVILLNDSVFAVRHYSEYNGVLQALQDENFNNNHTETQTHVVGLSSSNVGGYWLESVHRGFTKVGTNTFMGHSCVHDANHQSFGSHLNAPWRKKRAIVDHHEIGLVHKFPPNPTWVCFHPTHHLIGLPICRKRGSKTNDFGSCWLRSNNSLSPN